MNETWFILALAAPLLWAAGNFIDKGLIHKLRHTEGPVGVLILYSSLFSAMVLVVIACLNPSSLLSLPASNMLVMVIAGIVDITAIYLYLLALEREETSVVMPLYQVIPVFGLLLGYVLLGETISSAQMFAGAVVLGGGMLLAFDFEKGRIGRLKAKTLAIAIAASFCFALFDALFKLGAEGNNFWVAIFWQHIGVLLVGVVLFFGHANHRGDFIRNLRTDGVVIFGLNIFNESIYVAGVILVSAALLLAPIALVATVGVYQPVFIFVGSIILATLLPRVFTDRITLPHLIHKGIAVLIIVIGSIMLIS